MAKTIEHLKALCTQVRRDILRMVHGAESGHPGASLGCTEFLVALYFHHMQHQTDFNMDGKNEDMFFLSNGHISPVFYSVLSRAGYFDTKEMATFRQINSRLQGHPTTHEGLPGVRIASGSLGQGLSVAIGAALGKKMDGDQRLVFALTGDGELQEGQVWEALMFAAHNKVDNLIATVDYNGQQIDGPVDEINALGDLKAKFLAFGWETLVLDEGNDLQQVIDILDLAKKAAGKGKPVALLLRTAMGHGVDFMTNSHKWHGVAPDDAQLEKALAQLPVSEHGDY